MKENSKKMGFLSVILLGMNGIVGSGIFLLPGKVMALMGSWSLLVYVFVAVLVMSIAWCFAQCASLFERNGAAYVYAKAAFGNFIGFQVGILRWISGIIAWASLAVGLVTAISTVFPAILLEPYRSLFILSWMGGLALLNIRGLKIFQYFNNLITVAKMVPLILLTLLGLFFINQANFLPQPEQTIHIDTFGSASLLIFYAFGGFESLPVAAAEMKDPKKNLPLAVMIIIAFCSLFYLVIQTVAIGVLGPDLASSATPMADIAEKLLGPTGKWAVTVAMLISIGGVNLASSFNTPRSGVALAENHMLPPIMAKKNLFGTPYVAILITVSLASLIALSGNFTQLVMISVIARFVQYLSTCVAVIVFHRRGQLKHLKMWIPLLAITGIFWLLGLANTQQLLWGAFVMGLGIVLYFAQNLFKGTISIDTQDEKASIPVS